LIRTKIIFDHQELAKNLKLVQRPLVFTNGVFDIIHKGHVLYLEGARAMGASLLVAINSDFSAKGLEKGPDRPLNSEEDRVTVIASLESVSIVTLFHESNPCRLLEMVRPDVYVKGGDYEMSELEEAKLMQSFGGKAIALDYTKGYSTTSLVKRIKSE
jgi:rfaE bifunctional protein nucleotidyltransferase chain/domain